MFDQVAHALFCLYCLQPAPHDRQNRMSSGPVCTDGPGRSQHSWKQSDPDSRRRGTAQQEARHLSENCAVFLCCYVLSVNVLCRTPLSSQVQRLHPVPRGGRPEAVHHGRGQGGLRRLKYADFFPSRRCHLVVVGRPSTPSLGGSQEHRW